MANDSVRTLLAEIGRHPLLTPAEEIHLARSVRAWLDHPDGPDNAPRAVQRRGRRAKDRMITANLRLVVMVAKKLRKRGGDDALLENIQEGTFGLARAAERFDPERGYKFSTFAHHWIWQAIGRAIEKTGGGAIYIPSGALDRWKAISCAVERYEREHGRRPSIAYLAETLGLTTEQVQASAVVGRALIIGSLDSRVRGTDHDTTLLDNVPDGRPDGLEVMADAEIHQQRGALLDALVESLEPIDRETAMDHRDGVPVLEVATQRSCSRSRVGQLRLRATRRMRENADLLAPNWRELAIA